MAAPKIGEVHDGYAYKGGDPSIKGSWSYVGDGSGGAAARPDVMQDTKTDQEYLATARTQAEGTLDTATQAERFMKLNKDYATGPGGKIPLLAIPLPFVKQPAWGDVAGALSPKYQAMKSITGAIGPKMRPPGSGSSSDADTKLYLEGVPSVDKLGSANQIIAKRLQVDSNRASARAAFLDKWYSTRGTLLGAEPAFQQFWASPKAAKYRDTSTSATAQPKTQGDGWRIVP